MYIDQAEIAAQIYDDYESQAHDNGCHYKDIRVCYRAIQQSSGTIDSNMGHTTALMNKLEDTYSLFKDVCEEYYYNNKQEVLYYYNNYSNYMRLMRSSLAISLRKNALN